MTASTEAVRTVHPSGCPRRLNACVLRWPGCHEGGTDSRCCRYPGWCICTVYDRHTVTENELEPQEKASR